MFALSLTVTLLLVLMLCGFVAVDQAADQYGFGGIISSLEVREVEDALHYIITSRAGNWSLDLEPLNTLVGLRRQYDVYTMPRSARLLEKLGAVIYKTYENLHEQRLEREYQQNIAGQ